MPKTRKNRRIIARKNARKNTRRYKRGGQRANASTCPPGQIGVNFKNWGGNCGPYNSSYKLMTGMTQTIN